MFLVFFRRFFLCLYSFYADGAARVRAGARVLPIDVGFFTSCSVSILSSLTPLLDVFSFCGWPHILTSVEQLYVIRMIS